jgi:AraC-like DNA-binding protein
MPDLNKPAIWVEGGSATRSPRWYLWEGGYFVMGQAGGEVPAHAHHAIQIFVSMDGKGAFRLAGGEWREARGFIVRADVEHSFNASGSTGAMLFVDPESSEGAWLQTVLHDEVTVVPDSRLEACIGELRAFYERPLESKPIGELIRHCVLAFCAGAPPSRRLDPRVTRVLKAIRESEDLKMSLESAAELAHLSPGRFAHLFTEQLGLPFRRYILWRKLTRAMLAIGRERTIAAAAHASDFSDAAHLTRTFYQMFGIPPSVMMRGEFFEIPSPFALAE